MNILVFGASNAGKWFEGQQQGETAFQSVFSSAGVELTLINATDSGTSSEDWLTTGTGTPYQNLLDKITVHIDAAVFIQGGADSWRLHLTAGEYQANIETLFSRIRADSGEDNLPIYMQRLFPPDFDAFPIDEIFTGQKNVAANDPYTTLITHSDLLSQGQDYTHLGSRHYTEATYSFFADDIARTILSDLAPDAIPALRILGTTLSDSLNGDEAFNRIYGLLGDDELAGNGGRDMLSGGRGDDTLHGGDMSDLLGGGHGDDILCGGSEADSLYGEYGNDKLMGGEGRDTLIGGSGDDTLIGGAGADTLIGGRGHDLFVVDDLDTIIGFRSGLDQVIYNGVVYTDWP